MELSSKAKEELKDLTDRTIYLMEKDLYQDMLAILKNDLDFFDKVKLEFNDKKDAASFNVETKILSINLEGNYYHAKKFAYSWREMLKSEDIEDFTKYVIFFIILHEATHAEQSAYVYEDYSKFPEVNRLYRRIFDLDEWWNIPMRINYRWIGEAFSFERNANLNAFREILAITPEKYHDIFKMGVSL